MNKVLLKGKWINRIATLLILFSMCNCNPSSNSDMLYKIDIWDYNFSQSFTVKYHFDNDSIIVKRIGTLVGETDSVLVSRKLTIEENKIIQNYLNLFPIETIEENYENKLIEDGDQKKIDIKINNITKSILISNVYQKDVDELYKILNSSLEDNLKIKSKMN